MRYKKVIVILLSLLLMFMFYGCTKDKGTTGVDKNTVMYKEIIIGDVLEAEYISSIDMNSDNELILRSEGDISKYIVLDEKEEVKKEITVDYSGRADMFTIDNNNNMYILSEIPERNEKKDIVGIRKKFLSYNNESSSITEDNVIGELNETTARSTEEMTIKIEADSKGNIYVLKLNGSIEVFDNSFNSKKVLDSIAYKDIEIDEEDNLLALHKNIDKKTLDKIDTSSYKTIWTKEYKDTDAPERIYYNKNTKNLYGINSGWIAKYDSKGNMTNRILNTGELSDIEFIVDFVVDKSEEIYLVAETQKSYKLIKYTKSDSEIGTNSRAKEKTEVTIELRKDWDNLFTKAEKKFENKYPDIKITINTNPDLSTGQYRERLNTELMTGKGSDILYLNSWDYLRSYMEKGILVNLDEMIKEDEEFNINEYNETIINMTKYKNKLYAMPINYHQFYILVLNEKLLDEKGISLDDNLTWRNVYDLSEELNENSKEKIFVLPEIPDEILFDQIILQDIDYYMDWDKKEAKFDSREFIETLKLLKCIKEDDIMDPELDWDHNATDAYKNPKDNLKNLVIYLGQIHAYHPYVREFGSYFDYNFKAVSAPKGEYTGTRQLQSIFLGINTNSKYKEEAWKFIKYMLTEEMQLSDEGYFHINNKANEKEKDGVFEFQEEYKKEMERNNYYYVQEEDIKELDRIIGDLNKLRIGDPFYDIVYEEIQPFLNGEKAAEEVAKQLQNKAEIYLNE